MMADYYPVIARAVSSLADKTPQARQALYKRARVALFSELHKHDPPLSLDQIIQETLALDAAIKEVEAEITGNETSKAVSPKPIATSSVPVSDETLGFLMNLVTLATVAKSGLLALAVHITLRVSEIGASSYAWFAMRSTENEALPFGVDIPGKSEKGKRTNPSRPFQRQAWDQ
jgi:hypothetical protein